jgi:hypothetical protein
MNAPRLDVQNYSADVRMELRLNGSVLTISHLGPDYLILARPVDHPPAPAEIIVSIDGNQRRRAVYLPAGLSTESRRVPIAACQAESDGPEALRP